MKEMIVLLTYYVGIFLMALRITTSIHGLDGLSESRPGHMYPEHPKHKVQLLSTRRRHLIFKSIRQRLDLIQTKEWAMTNVIKLIFVNELKGDKCMILFRHHKPAKSHNKKANH